MRRAKPVSLLAITLLMISPIAWGAGFDCSRAKHGIEQRICSDQRLSQLDDQLAQSFADARMRAGQQRDALLRDQRHWLAVRDKAVSESVEAGASAYQDRILFLDRLFKDLKATSPLLQAIGEHMLANPSTARGTGRLIDWWPYLGGDGKVFSTGIEPKIDDAKSFDFNPRDALNLPGISDYLPMDTPTIVLFDAAHLGGVYVENGMSSVPVWQLFSWHDHTVRAIDLPYVFQDDTSLKDCTLSLYEGTVYALRSDDHGLAISDITAQPYVNGHWGDPVVLQLHYETYLSPPDFYCAEKDCAKLIAVAADIIGRYNQTNDDDALAASLTADQRAKFTVMRQQAEKETTATAARFGDLAFLPDFHPHPKYIGDGSFLWFDGDTLFPVQWRGELLLARIGKGCYSPTQDVVCSEDILLGIWRWDGRVFTPVLGMVRHMLRGDFLLEELLPADLHAPN